MVDACLLRPHVRWRPPCLLLSDTHVDFSVTPASPGPPSLIVPHVFVLLVTPHPVCFCREIFPYLVVVIGLENVLVLTKSVVSTPVDLEVKLRIAQGEERARVRRVSPSGCGSKPVCLFHAGLSNESWSIMKNMATELCIVLIGYFTLVPAIQVPHPDTSPPPRTEMLVLT